MQPMTPAMVGPGTPTAASPPMGMLPWPSEPRRGNAPLFATLIVALMLMLAGFAVLHSRGLVDPVYYGYPYQQPPSEFLAYARTIRLLTFVGDLLVTVGIFVLLTGGFFAAVYKPDLPEGVRRAAVMGPVSLAIVWFIMYFLTGGYLGYSFP